MLAPSEIKPSGCGDEAVQATNDDAATCKMSAVRLGYWDDPYLQSFVKGPIDRRSPEINRGYFARTYSIFSLVTDAIKQFSNLKTESSHGDIPTPFQVINLGAGSDTLFWRLVTQEGAIPANMKLKSFIDVDFPPTARKKIHYLSSDKKLMAIAALEGAETKSVKNEFHSSQYHIIGIDLRDELQLDAKLKNCNVSGDVPTIFIAECVLVYLDAKASQNLLTYISRNFDTAVFINYEQANMNDNFAQIMLKNLDIRGCQLSGVAHCKSLGTQIERFTSTGWNRAYGWTMTDVYDSLPAKEVARIEKIELLDEKILLKQLLDHYCIVVAMKFDPGVSMHDVGLK